MFMSLAEINSNTPGPRSTMQRADSVQNGLKADAPPVYDQPEYIDEDLNDGPASFE